MSTSSPRTAGHRQPERTTVNLVRTHRNQTEEPVEYSADFGKLFVEDMTRLYLLSYFLTANHEMAERQSTAPSHSAPPNDLYLSCPYSSATPIGIAPCSWAVRETTFAKGGYARSVNSRTSNGEPQRSATIFQAWRE